MKDPPLPHPHPTHHLYRYRCRWVPSRRRRRRCPTTSQAPRRRPRRRPQRAGRPPPLCHPSQPGSAARQCSPPAVSTLAHVPRTTPHHTTQGGRRHAHTTVTGLAVMPHNGAHMTRPLSSCIPLYANASARAGLPEQPTQRAQAGPCLPKRPTGDPHSVHSHGALLHQESQRVIRMSGTGTHAYFSPQGLRYIVGCSHLAHQAMMTQARPPTHLVASFCQQLPPWPWRPGLVGEQWRRLAAARLLRNRCKGLAGLVCRNCSLPLLLWRVELVAFTQPPLLLHHQAGPAMRLT